MKTNETYVEQLERENRELCDRIASIRAKLEEIVCTVDPDRGVVSLCSEGSTHYDPERKCQVYDHENFSPLGDALIELYEMTAPS